MPRAMSVAPVSPSASRIASVAGVLRLRQPVRPKRIDADERDRRVEDHDSGDAQQQRPYQVAPRIAHFGGDEAGRLPAAIGEHDRRHRRPDGCKHAADGCVVA